MNTSMMAIGIATGNPALGMIGASGGDDGDNEACCPECGEPEEWVQRETCEHCAYPKDGWPDEDEDDEGWYLSPWQVFAVVFGTASLILYLIGTTVFWIDDNHVDSYCAKRGEKLGDKCKYENDMYSPLRDCHKGRSLCGVMKSQGQSVDGWFVSAKEWSTGDNVFKRLRFVDKAEDSDKEQ